MEKMKMDASVDRFADLMPQLCDLGGMALSKVPVEDFDSIVDKSVP